MGRSPSRVLVAVAMALAAVACGSADLERPAEQEPSATAESPAPSASPEPASPEPSQTPEPRRPIDLSAAVALDNCSGSLVRFATSEGGDRALVLTNGHCYEGGFLRPGQALVDEPSSRPIKLLDADGGRVAELRAASIAYATMTVTDVLLYELTRTYDEIEQATGVAPLTLATQLAPVGTEISVVSGYWRRIYTCTIDSYVHRMREAGWTWNRSLQYRQPGCEIIGGTSGSPVISHETGEVVAVNNTANERGRRCTLNNPCEVAPDGSIHVERGESYAQQTALLYGCLTDDRKLDPSLAGCRLPAG